MVSGVVFNKFTPHNYLYSGTSDSGHSEEWTTSLQWTTCVPPANNCMHVRTSEEGTTSEKWTKHSSPTCPLFGGSTVYHPPPYVPLSLMSENTHTIIFLHFQHHTPQHTDIPYSTSIHTESYDFLPPSEPFFEKTTDSFCTSDIAHIYTHTENTQNTHTIITPLSPTHTESYDFLPPSEPLFEKTKDFTECLDILLASGDGYEYTETFSVLLTATSDYKINASQNTTQITILDSDSEWSVYVSYDLCMLTICKVYESLHHYKALLFVSNI